MLKQLIRRIEYPDDVSALICLNIVLAHHIACQNTRILEYLLNTYSLKGLV